MRELDHVFAFVADPDRAAARLDAAGFQLDEGQAHAGQGTRNRRLPLGEQFFELVWMCDRDMARANPLRLDRRADWRHTGASPFGVAFRGELAPEDRDAYWLYDELGPRIWIHEDNERCPECPMALVVEADEERRAARRDMLRRATAARRNRTLEELRLTGPALVRLPVDGRPGIVAAEGGHHLELVVDAAGSALQVSDPVTIRV